VRNGRYWARTSVSRHSRNRFAHFANGFAQCRRSRLPVAAHARAAAAAGRYEPVPISDGELIAEAVLVARAQGANPHTLRKYELHLHHYGDYLHSARRHTLLTARRKDVAMFLAHLCELGGQRPHPARRAWQKGILSHGSTEEVSAGVDRARDSSGA
jgi:hypothetical protein